MKDLKTIYLFILIQSVLTFAPAGIIYALWGNKSAASYFTGSFLLYFNTLVLTFAWSLITKKKLVALPVMLIVIKYAILGVIIYQILNQEWLSYLEFFLGLGSLILTVVIFGLLQNLRNEKETE